MKRLGFSEEQQTAINFILLEKISKVEEELISLEDSTTTSKLRDSLSEELMTLNEIVMKSSTNKIVIGRQVGVTVKQLKFDGIAGVDPQIEEGIIYCSQFFCDGETIQMQISGHEVITVMEEFMIDHLGQVYIPISLNLANEKVIVNFQLILAPEGVDYAMIIGRDPIRGMLLDPSVPEESEDDGIYLYHGMG